MLGDTRNTVRVTIESNGIIPDASCNMLFIQMKRAAPRRKHT